MNVAILCEFSAVARDAFRARGHDARSVDLLPTEGDSQWHIQSDAIKFLTGFSWNFWHLIIMHPTCTRLTVSGNRWRHEVSKGRTLEQIEEEFHDGCRFYRDLRAAALACCSRVAIENPVMRGDAKSLIGNMGPRHIIQPWQFGEPAFKATGFELYNLPPLQPTKILTPPNKISDPRNFKAWSAVHHAAPGPDRWKDRSRTYPGIAAAMADQWGSL